MRSCRVSSSTGAASMCDFASAMAPRIRFDASRPAVLAECSSSRTAPAPRARASGLRRRPACGSRKYITAAPAATHPAAFINAFIDSLHSGRTMLPAGMESLREDPGSAVARALLGQRRHQLAHELALRWRQRDVSIHHSALGRVEAFPCSLGLADPGPAAPAVLQHVRVQSHQGRQYPQLVLTGNRLAIEPAG